MIFREPTDPHKKNHWISGMKNSWNRYSKEDLKRIGLNVEKWDPKEVQEYIETQGIQYYEENDVKKLNIQDCQCQCINCREMIIYSAKDCFI